MKLDEDLVRLLSDEAQRLGRSVDQVLNEAVAAAAYQIVPHMAKLAAGLDPAGFNRLIDEIEDEERLRRI